MAVFQQLMAARRLLPGQGAGLQDVVAVDFDPAATWITRLKANGAQPVLTAASRLPAVVFGGPEPPAFSLPKPMAARYVAIAVPSHEAIIKLLNLPGAIDQQMQEQIRDHMGVRDGAYRYGYRVIAQNRMETRILTVALPEAQVHAARGLFVSGLPAPLALEISGLAVMSAFLRAVGTAIRDQAVGLVVFGSRATFFAFFKNRELILIRKFEFGFFTLLDRIEQTMGVNRDTALEIVADRSFDITQTLRDLADPFVKQLVISKHFVERRESCQIAGIYLADDSRVSQEWIKDIKAATGLETAVWRPLDAVTVLPGALPEPLLRQQAQMAAALGAGLAALEEHQHRGGAPA